MSNYCHPPTQDALWGQSVFERIKEHLEISICERVHTLLGSYFNRSMYEAVCCPEKSSLQLSSGIRRFQQGYKGTQRVIPSHWAPSATPAALACPGHLNPLQLLPASTGKMVFRGILLIKINM